MSKPTIINKFGKLTGWNSITWNWFNRDVEYITQLAYDDNLDIEGVKGANKFDIGYGEGNYSTNGSVTLGFEEIRGMMDKLPEDVMLQQVSTNVVVEFESGGNIYQDILHNVRILNNGVDISQGDKSTTYQLNLYIPYIERKKVA